MQAIRPPEGQYIRVGDFDIHVLTLGSGPAVVFLHGSGPGASAYSNFKQNIDAVVDAGCQAILVDMIGFGYSSKPTDRDYTTELFAATTKAALDGLGVQRCTLVGNSLGGAICIRLALDHPDWVERLVLMAPGGIEERETYFAMPGIAKMVSAFVDGALDREGLTKVLHTLVHDKSLITPELVEERFCILETQPPEVLSRMVIPSMADELGALGCPVFGFWGEQDEMTPVSGVHKFLRQCAQCQFLVLASCGHWVMLEHTRLFNSMLGQILSRHGH